MNRNGQTLIIFVIMIPLFLLLAAIVVDIGLVTNARLKLSGTTTTVLKEFYDDKKSAKLESEIKDLYLKNKIPTENLKIKSYGEFLEIENKYEVKSVFGQLIGIESYPLSIHKKITKENEKWIITKE